MLYLVIEVEHFFKVQAPRTSRLAIYKNSNFPNVIYGNYKFELLVYC